MGNEVQEMVSTEKKKTRLSIISLSLGIVGVLLGFCFGVGIILAIPALALGIIVLVKKKNGKKMAIAGCSLGAIGILISLVSGAIFLTQPSMTDAEYAQFISDKTYAIVDAYGYGVAPATDDLTDENKEKAMES